MEKRNLMLSRRGESIPLSPIRKLTPYADEAKRSGVRILHLNIGQPDIRTPEPILREYRTFREPVIAYGPSLGLPRLRESISGYYRRYGLPVDPEDVAVTIGGSEAILFALAAVCDPGDEILVREPFYANYISFATMLSARIVPIPSSLDRGFTLPSRDEIACYITPRTKAMLYINPENPTGIVWDRAEMETLRDLCMKHGLFLISDEVYREFIYDEETSFTSILDLEGFEQHAVLIDSISKRFSACGTRIGSLVSKNRGVMETVNKLAQARLCPPAVGQLAADAGYRMDPSYFLPIRDEYRRRRDTVVAGLREIPGAAFHVPEGAFYVMARLPVRDAEDFCIFMLHEFRRDGTTIMLTPGNGFYSSPRLGMDEIRIAYVLNTGDLAEGMDILKRGLAAYAERGSPS